MILISHPTYVPKHLYIPYDIGSFGYISHFRQDHYIDIDQIIGPEYTVALENWCDANYYDFDTYISLDAPNRGDDLKEFWDLDIYKHNETFPIIKIRSPTGLRNFKNEVKDFIGGL